MKEICIQFIKHKTAKSIVVEFARYYHPRMCMENLLKQKVGLCLDMGDGNIHSGTVGELITVVKNMGLWGFCDKITHGRKTPDIHYWVSKPTEKERIKVMELFAHEVGHAVGYNSEKMATKFGGVAGFAYMSMIEEIYPKEK